MEPASCCVFNVTRNALLSERVISVSEPQTPTQLLALVMNGPARDPHFCIRLTKPSVASDVPRLFAFDVAYLDAEQRILQVADVGPGTPFPDLSEQVATILFLSDQLLANSNTEAGDCIRICTEAEIAAILRATAQFQAIESPGWPIESHGPTSTVALDPFAGSLVYMPSSGTPQNTEIFLSSRAAPPVTAEIAPEEMTAEPILEDPPEPLDELSDTEERVLVESSDLTIDGTQLPEEFDPVPPSQPESPSDDLPPLTRIFEAADQQVCPPDLPTDETQQVPSPKRSQLPFSFKAVIQFVDDQLRREKQQEAPSTSPAPPVVNNLPEIIQLAEPSIVPEVQQPVIAEQLLASPVPEETTEALPDLSSHDFLELSEIEATAIEESEPPPIEALPLEETVLEVDESLQSLPESSDLQPFVPLEVPQEPVDVAMAAPEPPPLPAAEPRPARIHEISPAVGRADIPVPPQIRVEPVQKIRFGPKEKLPFATRVQRWLAGESISLSGNRRRGERLTLPGLVAFYFTGGAPKAHEIINISTTGLYLRSKELWSPNTLVRMTLERQDAEYGEKKSISVLARVVRVDEGGIGHEFVTTEVLKNLRARDFLPQQGTNRRELEKFLAAPK